MNSPTPLGLAHGPFDICWRYADILNNFTICTALLFLPSGNSWRVMIAFSAYLFCCATCSKAADILSSAVLLRIAADTSSKCGFQFESQKFRQLDNMLFEILQILNKNAQKVLLRRKNRRRYSLFKDTSDSIPFHSENELLRRC